jgi:hypothetical protein
MTGECVLSGDCGRDRVARTLEHDEEGVSLRIEFRAGVLNERGAK